MDFGFDGKEPTPCSSRANDLAQAFLALIEAKARLDAAEKSAPNYTAQWSRKDFFANELEAYYRAADDLEAVIKPL